MSRKERLKIQNREQDIANRLDTSATTARAARIALLVPEDVRGLTIVDLGSGASSFVPELLAQGAQAFGVDQMYSDSQKMHHMISESFEKVLSRIPDMYREMMERTTTLAIQKFLASFEKDRTHYKAAWFSRLPFSDNFSDLTTSLNALSDLAEEYPLFRSTVFEAIRITKPKRNIVIAPFHTREGFHTRYSSQHENLASELASETSHQIHVVKPDESYKDSRLIITKSLT